MAIYTCAHAKKRIESGEQLDPLMTCADKVRASQIDPEFVDVDGLGRGFGIKRSLAYQLLAGGLINGMSLRRGNAIRGKRLFQLDSVRAYLKSRMESDGKVGGVE
jgi:hypothetical protein